MTRIQEHRGPDGDGHWRSANQACVLGHRRLAILDLSPAGAQPMVDEDAQLAITFNGEIYNYVELRDELRTRGHTFRTASDTEVLLRAFVEWGDGCLSRLNGMFAFAIWNERTQEIFCARDRFGEKPFHFCWARGSFAFASEIKALALLDGARAEIDAGVLAAFADRGASSLDASERTLVMGVSQLLPGHAMRIRRTSAGVLAAPPFSYFDLNLQARHPYGADDLRASGQRLRELLAESVRLRLRSDVRVGSCLSGGLDSSTVVSLMRQLEPDAEIRTFTGRFPGDPMDEGPYAQLIVEASGTTHHETEPSAQRFLRDCQNVFWHAELPIGGMSQFAQYCVFGLAKEHDVTVLLDGQGSDEQLGGYGSTIALSFLRQLTHERRWSAFLHERAKLGSAAPAMFSWPKLALHHSPLKVVGPLIRAASGRSPVSRADYFNDDFLHHARTVQPHSPLDWEGDATSLSETLWSLSFRTMLSALLRFGDRLSMAHSREVRLPFCDHRITEFAFAMSPELLVGDGQAKRVLRAAIDGLVPRAIVERPKQGFVPPQTKWLVGPLADWVKELANDPGPVKHVLDMKRVHELVHATRDVRLRDVSVLWDVANLLAWSRYSLSEMRKLPSHATQETHLGAASSGVTEHARE